jgi:hypothetical protein
MATRELSVRAQNCIDSSEVWQLSDEGIDKSSAREAMTKGTEGG